MAINDLPAAAAPADPSRHALRSYREAASYLAESERRHLRLQPSRPLQANGGERKKKPAPCGGSSPPRSRPVSSRCRSRAPSPPQPCDDQGRPCGNKAPRSVSPGGTPAASAGAALRQGEGQGSPPPAEDRRVRWATAVVASVRTRPRTPREDVPILFYSRADEKRFRREAESTPPVEEAWGDAPPATPLAAAPPRASPPRKNFRSVHKPLWSPQRERKDYAISRAVVVFGDSTRTYAPPAPPRGLGCAVEVALESEAPFSFDDAAFWNGQLTWS